MAVAFLPKHGLTAVLSVLQLCVFILYSIICYVSGCWVVGTVCLILYKSFTSATVRPTFNESFLFYTFRCLLPDADQAKEVHCQEKAQSVQKQLCTNQAISQFVSSSPSHLFVFLFCSFSCPLVSSSVWQSVCSEVFIIAACLPSSRRDKQLFKILDFSLATYNQPLTLPDSKQPPSPLFPPFSPFSSILHVSAKHQPFYYIFMEDHRAVLFLLREQQGLWLCVWHLVTTVPNSRGSWVNTNVEILEACEQLVENVDPTERHCSTITEAQLLSHSLWGLSGDCIYDLQHSQVCTKCNNSLSLYMCIC